tara:strand:+ start:1559 stop:1735 length:177 start_codon:yes stop_codon:yes gene_type:complete
MKFSNKNPVITKNKFQYEMHQLNKEFEKLMLHNAVVASYLISPCYQAKERIKALKKAD